jgi:hypothetical protein
MARYRHLSGAALAFALLVQCGSPLPQPRIGEHPQGATDFVEVPYPPPPARVEIVPAQPSPAAVWVDGEWAYRNKRWVWEPGGWVLPPANGYFAPWMTRRTSDGRLYFVAGRWHAADGKPLPKPPVLALAETSLTGEAVSPADAGPPPSETAPPVRGAPWAPGDAGAPPSEAGPMP